MTPDRFDAALPHLVDVPAAVHERLLSLFDDRSTPVTERLVRNDDHWSATLAVRGDGDGDGDSGTSTTLVFRGSSVDLIVDVSAASISGVVLGDHVEGSTAFVEPVGADAVDPADAPGAVPVDSLGRFMIGGWSSARFVLRIGRGGDTLLAVIDSDETPSADVG